jgi:5-methylthioribose kinase
MTNSKMDIEIPTMLLAYLRDREKIKPSEIPAFITLDGGVSNRTVWVKRKNKQDWILKQALEKLRVKVDWFSAPERIHREAAGLRWFTKIIPEHVPEFIFEDDDDHILAMSAIPQPHENWKTVLLKGQTQLDHAILFGQLLAKIHNAVDDYPSISTEFADRKFFEELRLEPYYSYTATQVPEAEAMLTQLIDDTRQRQLSLVHGDYSPKNVLIYNDSLYILDYEVIHFGDPAFDVGFSMTHFLSKAHYLRDHRQAFLELATVYWQAYHDNIADHLAHTIQPYVVRHTLACMLARVAGRSPLEYLNDTHRQRQQEIIIDLITKNIQTVPDLIGAFTERLASYNESN